METYLLKVKARTLWVLALISWCAGGVALLFKGSSLLQQAQFIHPQANWPILAAVLGCLIGITKAKFIFNKSCRRNLERINNLNQPRIWQFFKPWFFIFLAAMILLGGTLSRLAQGNYEMLIGVAILDLSVGVALIWSSRIFWQQ